MLGTVLLYAAVSLVVSFLLGSIPWGLIISKVFYKVDVREHGSGNIGTTNAVRTLGKAGGIAVFVLDFLKGMASGLVGYLCAVFCVYALQTDSVTSSHLLGLVMGLAFLGCVGGHIYSPWLKFKGGKGIAVAVGCIFLVFGPFLALVELGVFVILVVATRYVSVGSIAAAVVCPLIAWWASSGEPVFITICTLTALLIIWAHRGNINRLRAGTENRLGKFGGAKAK
ncbi:MAG: glycerol-3-phosphate 1-O-acyltransferase PlsY [Coriobacteriia bacterium]|nr:glycerol-3-phosphate 1-O-acyltransferase PlsY [Coriobacteriia bacterium]